MRQAGRAGHRVGTGLPAVAEVLYGLEYGGRPDDIRRFEAGLRRLILWPFDLAAAREFGRLMAVLRRAGRPMQVTDVRLAAIALSLGNCTVVTSDTDLSAVPGLAVENWAA